MIQKIKQRISNAVAYGRKGWSMEVTPIALPEGEKILSDSQKSVIEDSLESRQKQQQIDDERILGAANRLARITGSPLQLVEERLRANPELVESAENYPEECIHKWHRGVLPGQKYIKTCKLCGTHEQVTIDEWQNLG